jgi:hypothetical protein
MTLLMFVCSPFGSINLVHFLEWIGEDFAKMVQDLKGTTHKEHRLRLEQNEIGKHLSLIEKRICRPNFTRFKWNEERYAEQNETLIEQFSQNFESR